MTSLLQLVYASSATQIWEPRTLLQLLTAVRKNNGSIGITGLLGHNAGSFLQMLEGPPEVVRSLLARIRTDPRHDNLTVLVEREVTVRFFPDWSMGFQELDQVIRGPGLSHALPPACSPATWSTRPEAALDFFELCRVEAEGGSVIPVPTVGSAPQ